MATIDYAMSSEQGAYWRERAAHWEQLAKSYEAVIDRLECIAKRAGAWEDRNGNIVYGSDPVVCDAHDVVYHAADIEKNLRKFYYLKTKKQ